MASGAHTPVMFAKGGGNAMFSKGCVDLLAEVGFSPEQFGSYSQISDQIDQERSRAKRRTKKLRARERVNGKLTPLEKSKLEQYEREGSVEVAHLGQNATKQRQRKNPCSNMVDGHSHDDYPCVVIGGPARKAGKTNEESEHGRQTIAEEDAARAAGTRDEKTSTGRRADDSRPDEGSVYSAEQMAKDERARAAAICKDKERGGASTSKAQDAGAMPAEPSAKQNKSLKDYKKTLNTRATEGEGHPVSTIDGETAAECIDTFKQMGEAAMKKKMEESATANAKAAKTPKERKKLRDNVKRKHKAEADAKTKLEEAKKERVNAKAAVRNSASRKGSKEGEAGHEKWKADDKARTKRLEDADKAVKTAKADCDAAAKESKAARTASSRLENANCRAKQGKRLASKRRVRKDGRVPYTPPPEKKDTTPGNGSTGLSTG